MLNLVLVVILVILVLPVAIVSYLGMLIGLQSYLRETKKLKKDLEDLKKELGD